MCVTLFKFMAKKLLQDRLIDESKQSSECVQIIKMCNYEPVLGNGV